MDRVVRGELEPSNQQSWALGGGGNVIYRFEQFDWNSY